LRKADQTQKIQRLHPLRKERKKAGLDLNQDQSPYKFIWEIAKKREREVIQDPLGLVMIPRILQIINQERDLKNLRKIKRKRVEVIWEERQVLKEELLLLLGIKRIMSRQMSHIQNKLMIQGSL